jgi:hypothetical protein
VYICMHVYLCVRLYVLSTDLRLSHEQVHAHTTYMHTYIHTCTSQSLHPWLIEANLSPDLRPTTETKSTISTALVEELMHIVVDVGQEALQGVSPVGTCTFMHACISVHL